MLLWAHMSEQQEIHGRHVITGFSTRWNCDPGNISVILTLYPIRNTGNWIDDVSSIRWECKPGIKAAVNPRELMRAACQLGLSWSHKASLCILISYWVQGAHTPWSVGMMLSWSRSWKYVRSTFKRMFSFLKSHVVAMGAELLKTPPVMILWNRLHPLPWLFSSLDFPIQRLLTAGDFCIIQK